jgi:hypothetical protein
MSATLEFFKVNVFHFNSSSKVKTSTFSFIVQIRSIDALLIIKKQQKNSLSYTKLCLSQANIYQLVLQLENVHSDQFNKTFANLRVIERT